MGQCIWQKVIPWVNLGHVSGWGWPSEDKVRDMGRAISETRKLGRHPRIRPALDAWIIPIAERSGCYSAAFRQVLYG